MSGPAYRYELRAGGLLLGKYKTLGQAMLGAIWRSRKRGKPVYVSKRGVGGRSLCQVDAYG